MRTPLKGTQAAAVAAVVCRRDYSLRANELWKGG